MDNYQKVSLTFVLGTPPNSIKPYRQHGFKRKAIVLFLVIKLQGNQKGGLMATKKQKLEKN